MRGFSRSATRIEFTSATSAVSSPLPISATTRLSARDAETRPRLAISFFVVVVSTEINSDLLSSISDIANPPSLRLQAAVPRTHVNVNCSANHGRLICGSPGEKMTSNRALPVVVEKRSEKFLFRS